MPARRTAAALSAALAMTLAGCGDDADPTAFAAATDRTCRDVAAAVTTLREELVRGDGDSVSAALRTAVDRYAQRVDRAASTLADAQAPDDDRDFRDGAVGALREHAATLRRAARQAASGTLPTALAQQLERTGPAALPEIPDGILESTPACRAAVR
jgi:hypothetical protein